MSHILVADDEEELLELIRFSLDSSGFQVTTVNNGKKALDKAQNSSFDMIILDVMMPEMDGYHVAHELSQNPKCPPILLLTSRDFTKDQNAVQGSGASAFLSKPFEIPELIDVVSALLKKNGKQT